MNEIDLKLKLLGGTPIKAIGYGDIKPLKIGEVIDYGYTDYLTNLNMINIEAKELLQIQTESEIEDLPSVFEIVLAIGGEDLENQMAMALTLFLGGEVVLDKENIRAIVYVEEDDVRVVDNENYQSVVEIIKYQNFIKRIDESSKKDFNPANDKTKKFKEKMKKLREMTDKAKKRKDGKEEENDVDFYDIISSITSKSNAVNELDVMNMTVYQVYEKFKRMEIIDQYDIGIKTLLAGGKDIQLKHWSSK